MTLLFKVHTCISRIQSLVGSISCIHTWQGHRCAVSWTVCQRRLKIMSDTSTDCSGVTTHSSHMQGQIPFPPLKQCKNSFYYQKKMQVYYRCGNYMKCCEWILKNLIYNPGRKQRWKNSSKRKECFHSLSFSFIRLTATHSSLIFVRHFHSLSTAAAAAAGKCDQTCCRRFRFTPSISAIFDSDWRDWLHYFSAAQLGKIVLEFTSELRTSKK